MDGKLLAKAWRTVSRWEKNLFARMVLSELSMIAANHFAFFYVFFRKLELLLALDVCRRQKWNRHEAQDLLGEPEQQLIADADQLDGFQLDFVVANIEEHVGTWDVVGDADSSKPKFVLQ